MHKTNLKYISIHALCEEGDLTRTALLLFLWIFLSTPSARRATLAGRFTSSTVLISIHALCEEGDPRPFRSLPTAANFYPRPLRGGRHIMLELLDDAVKFLSTPSARRATLTERR